MTLLDAIRNRRTTNSKYRTDPIRPDHLRLLVETAANAYPALPNGELPWRLVLIQEADRREIIAQLAGDSMRELMEGPFFQRYKKYFRFNAREIEKARDGIHIDRIPFFLRPFVRQVFSPASGRLMGVLGASRILGNNQAEIVRQTALILAIAINRDLYQPTTPTGLHAGVSLGALVQSFWLVTTSLGIGMQFISLPLEVPERKAIITEMAGVQPPYELVALFRLGYKDEAISRNTIDWVSAQRKPFDVLTGIDGWSTEVPPDLANAESLLFDPLLASPPTATP
jgi:nitroreductase